VCIVLAPPDPIFQSNSIFTCIKAELVFGTWRLFCCKVTHQLQHDRFEYQQHYIDCGYKDDRSCRPNGEFLMEKNALHIWPRGNYMLIALPIWTVALPAPCFFPCEGEVSFAIGYKRKSKNIFFEESS